MLSDYEPAEKPIGYNPEFLRRVRARRAAEAEVSRQVAQRQEAEGRVKRMDMLRHEANQARADALRQKMERDDAEQSQRRLLQQLALASATTDLQWIIAKALLLFDVTKVELKGSGRNAHVAFARQFIMYWARRRTGMSFPQIGRHIGGKDHTTVLHGCRAYVIKRAKQGRTLRPAR